MPPFEPELPSRELDHLAGSFRRNLRRVEPVAPPDRLGKDGAEVLGDECGRHWPLAKALQLGVLGIALGRAPQHGLGEKGLPPQRDEALPVEVFRM